MEYVYEVYRERSFSNAAKKLAVPKGREINQKPSDYQITSGQIRNRFFLQQEVWPVPLEKFREEPFVVLKPENDTRKCAMALCQEYGFSPHIVFELDQHISQKTVPIQIQLSGRFKSNCSRRKSRLSVVTSTRWTRG